jgi:hypothetical protein
MKRLISILLLVSAFRLDAALTLIDQGFTAGTGSAVATLSMSPNTAMVVGDTGIVLLTWSNSGSGGSTKIFTQATFTDPKGNVWTRQLDAIYHPGAANSGVEIAAYTTPITTQIGVTDSITVTASTATTSRIGYLYEARGLNGPPTFVAAAAACDGCTTGQTSTTPGVTSSSITTGDAIVAWNGQKDNGAVTGSSDTTNGTWSPVGTVNASTSFRISLQSKIVTGTGTIPWFISIANSVAWNSAWIQLREALVTQSATNGFMILAK